MRNRHWRHAHHHQFRVPSHHKSHRGGSLRALDWCFPVGISARHAAALALEAGCRFTSAPQLNTEERVVSSRSSRNEAAFSPV
eukprot:1373228-Rhodomonas_salina.3